jgi:hypothetical protein
MITRSAFNDSLALTAPPNHYTIHQRSLWHDAKKDWQVAHDLIDQLDDVISAHIHAYLHRKEGDQWNANYWYKRARQPVFDGSLENEFDHLFDLYA